VVVAILFATLQGLKKYTQHGISYPVPKLTGLTVNEAVASTQANKLRIAILDSVFNKNFAPGAIVDQQPAANSMVKENRTIFLTVNSVEPEKVALPRLTDISFRQAKVLVETSGLFVGNISYQPSEYNDLVLEVLQDSVAVKTGERIIKGSSIDFVVGRSKGNLKTPLPNLIGFNMNDAQSTLTAAKLNQGVIIYDETFETAEDSLNAKVWKQFPNPKFTKNVELGSSVDIWLSASQEKIDNAFEK
jgi:beta-lactam-binding protein with PASTA domain